MIRIYRKQLEGEAKMFTNYAAELLEFEKNGYVFIPNLLNREETDLLSGGEVGLIRNEQR
jgi:hypothetical protein